MKLFKEIFGITLFTSAIVSVVNVGINLEKNDDQEVLSGLSLYLSNIAIYRDVNISEEEFKSWNIPTISDSSSMFKSVPVVTPKDVDSWNF